jgi:endonuclease/exonuclease/phosphatase family metal-dependent hydrolase
MKIYSWNMLFRNRELDRAFDFIANSDFDIFCLQEVPEDFLKKLQALSSSVAYSIAHRSDVERLFPDEVKNNFIVTLSKHPITNRGEIQFPEYWHLLPLRTRIFVRMMRPFGFSMIRNRGGLYVDVTAGGKSMRVMNLHLILAQPAWRLKEFETAMAECNPSRPTIVCGDFNTIEAPHISILNWILGGKIRDAFFHRRERTNIDKQFVQHELVNTLSGSITHRLSRSQLDHILVSHSFSIKKAEVLSDRIGSDHHPIFVETV